METAEHLMHLNGAEGSVLINFSLEKKTISKQPKL